MTSPIKAESFQRSRVTLHLRDDPDLHSILLDGYAWEDVQAVRVELGSSEFTQVPEVTIVAYLLDSVRLVGRCKPLVGFPPDKLLDVALTFGHEKTADEPAEAAALYINGEFVNFRNLRLSVTGGQQVFVQFDRVLDSLPVNTSGSKSAHPTEWCAFFLVRGGAGNDVPPFDRPQTTTTPVPVQPDPNGRGYLQPGRLEEHQVIVKEKYGRE